MIWKSKDLSSNLIKLIMDKMRISKKVVGKVLLILFVVFFVVKVRIKKIMILKNIRILKANDETWRI